VIFALNEGGILEGIMTDGDFRRWLVKQETIDLQRPVWRSGHGELSSEVVFEFKLKG
jgi:hypothetical protein